MTDKPETEKELHLDDLEDEGHGGPKSVRGDAIAPLHGAADDADPPTPRVSTPLPPAVTQPTLEVLRGSRREPTWDAELSPHAPTKLSPPPGAREPSWAEETAVGPNTSPERLSIPPVLRVPRDLGHTPAPTSGPRILVVDDEPDLRAGLRAVLEDEGYNVQEAINGFDGIIRIFQMYPRIDLVFVDLMMKHLSGLDLIQIARASYAQDVPILVISGQPKPAELPGGMVFLRKGDLGDIDELLNLVRREIDEGRERRSATRR